MIFFPFQLLVQSFLYLSKRFCFFLCLFINPDKCCYASYDRCNRYGGNAALNRFAANVPPFITKLYAPARPLKLCFTKAMLSIIAPSLLQDLKGLLQQLQQWLFFLVHPCAASFSPTTCDNNANPPAIAAADRADFSICELSSRFASSILVRESRSCFQFVHRLNDGFRVVTYVPPVIPYR